MLYLGFGLEIPTPHCMQSRLASTKDDLMNRLNNALKQRDAAREDALLHANKLTKLQVLLLVPGSDQR